MRVFDKRGDELARESLYAEDDDDEAADDERARGADEPPHGPEGVDLPDSLS